MPPEMPASFEPQPAPETPWNKDLHVTPSEYLDLPEISLRDCATFGEKGPRIFSLCQNLRRWIQLPYLDDTYENHPARRDWRRKLTDEQKQFVLKNKWRSNPATIALLDITELKEILRETLDEITYGTRFQPIFLRAPKVQSVLRKGADIPKEQRKAALQLLDRKILTLFDAIQKTIEERKLT